MKRRAFLLGGLGLAAGGGYLMRPEAAAGGTHSAYFAGLSTALRKHSLARPTMIIDLDRLDRNIDLVVKRIGPDKAYRVVAKSLPSRKLLDYVMQRSGSQRLMAFHQSFLNEIAVKHPDTHVLLGKPMPVEAAARFYDFYPGGSFDPSRQLQWLVDTPERLKQYQELAGGRKLKMQINVEIDVGLHRGGMQDPARFAGMLQTIDADPNLQFGGLMGYEPHIAKAPATLGLQNREIEQSRQVYQEFLQVWRQHSGGKGEQELVLNAAGSPTFHLWQNVDGLANELSVGTGLVKPTDYDLDSLAEHAPALFIATPVLKAYDGPVQMPVLPQLGQLQSLWDPNRARTFFVYGGYWQAQPVSPPGLRNNGLYGHSSNQEMLNGPASIKLAVDDHVFYRPTQSEFVMLQFGDLAAVRAGRIVDFWPVFRQAA